MPDASPPIAERSPETARDRTPAYSPLVIVLVAVAAGILVDRYWPMPVAAWWSGAIAALSVWIVLWRRRHHRLAAVAVLLAVAATAGGWHHCRWFLFATDDLGHFARSEAEPVCVEVIALRSAREMPEPEPDPMRPIPVGPRTQLDARVAGIRDGETWRPAAGCTTLTVYAPLPGIKAGDRLQVFAKLAAPRPARNPGELDYAMHSRGKRLRSRLTTEYAECVSLVRPGSVWSVRRWLDGVRAHGRRTLQRYLSPDRADLAAAVLLGARENIEPEETMAFMKTGTVHLLAISGLHVGILATVLLFVMRRAPIPRGWAMLTVAGTVFFYMLLVDARPPVIRATILVLVVCWSIYLDRPRLSFNSLAAAALIVLALNPADLFGTGPQLSFLAVAGLMWFAPQWFDGTEEEDPLEKLIEQQRTWLSKLLRGMGRGLYHLALVSATIWLLTLPLVMARFHLLTPAALVLNTLLWVPMAVGLWCGFGTLVCGTVFPPLAPVFGRMCDLLLGLLQTTVDHGQHVPGSHFWVPGPTGWWLLGFYGSLAVFCAFPRICPPRRWCLGLLAVWTTVGFSASWLGHDDTRLDCSFLAMGHGCAIVLELPSGQTVLYDAGTFSSPTFGCRSISRFLWRRGITHIDAVVLSHGDLDHYNAMPGLLERFSVGVVYVSPYMFEHDNAALAALREAIDDSGVPMREILAGDRLGRSDDCRLEVLHPPRRGALGEDNVNSVVLAVECHGRRILLTGDLESPGLQDVLAEEPLDCDVLLAPHHGSRLSNCPELARWSTPEWVVVSGGGRWDLPEVDATYEAIGGQVLHTSRLGAVGVSIDRAGLTVERLLSK